MDQDPIPVEDFLAAITEALKIRGDARSIAVILNGDCRFESRDQDFGVDYWSLCISLPVYMYHALSDAELIEIKQNIAEVGQPFFASMQTDYLRGVDIFPKVGEAPADWRTNAASFLKGEGVTNQGRVRSDNIASMQHKGLLFRSQAEINLFDAIERAGLAVSPLPVFIRKGNSYHRLEPDFLVIFKGLTFIIEVDGDTFHRETPADADKRLVPLTHEGIEVRRIRAAEVASDTLADKTTKELIAYMNSRKTAR